MDAFLIDLTLVAETTMGGSLRNELSQSHPINLLLDGKTIERMAADRQDSLALVGSRDPASISVVSGQYCELPTQLLSVESLRSQIERGQQVLGKLLDREYRVFARRRFGLGNRWPSILNGFGFAGAVHATMDQGQFPEGSHPNIRWEGIDGEAVDAIGKPPLSAQSPDGFLNLGVTIGESLDSAHTATLVFAHWPGKTCDWFSDLKRTAKYADVLGKFLTLDEYFENINDPGFNEEFTADQYSTPFLAQAIIGKQPNPISRSVWYWRNEILDRCCQALRTMGCFVNSKAEFEEVKQRTDIDFSIENELGPEINEKYQAYFAELAESIAKGFSKTVEAGETTALLLNPCSFVRRVFVDDEKLNFVTNDEKPVYAADSKRPRQKVIDVPPMGFVRLHSSKTGKESSVKHAPLVEGLTLRNEFFEIAIDETTGGIRSVHRYDRRGNLFSQQLSMRGKPAQQSRRGGDFVYAKMVAEKVEVTSQSDVMAEISTQGKLVSHSSDDGASREFAKFCQNVRVIRGQRVIEINVDIQPTELPQADPWNSYYCSRIAWSNESAILYRAVNEARNAVSERRFEAPLYVDIDDADNCLTMISAGLPFHRRVGYRRLDSILITAGETARQFRFGIGVNLKNSTQNAIDFIAPLAIQSGATQSGATQSGATANGDNEFAFLFHFDKRNIIATFWEPLFENGQLRNDNAKCCGVRIRLNETQNRGGKLAVTTPFAVARCARVDFVGKVDSTGSVEDGKATFEFAANEYFEVEIYWQA
jgi:alpha-mannosidase